MNRGRVLWGQIPISSVGLGRGGLLGRPFIRNEGVAVVAEQRMRCGMDHALEIQSRRQRKPPMGAKIERDDLTTRQKHLVAFMDLAFGHREGRAKAVIADRFHQDEIAGDLFRPKGRARRVYWQRRARRARMEIAGAPLFPAPGLVFDLSGELEDRREGTHQASLRPIIGQAVDLDAQRPPRSKP